MSNVLAPPVSTTGAPAQAGELCPAGLQPVEVCPDWVQYTVPDGKSLEYLKEQLGEEGWVEQAHGMMGYARCLRRGNVKILLDGRAGQNMGKHVVISGQGCRELEASGAVKNWQHFFQEVLVCMEGHFTRLDVALDDTTGWLDLDVVGRAWQEDTYTSKWRASRLMAGLKHGEGHYEGLRRVPGHPDSQGARCVYFGSMQSQMFARIYDKAKEQNLPGEHWVRVEVVSRDERADGLARAVIREGFGVVAGVLRDYLEFKDADSLASTGEPFTRIESCPAASWWVGFLAGAKKAKLILAQEVRTLSQVREWVEKQVAPSLAMLVEAAGNDFSDLVALVQAGKRRLQPAQWALVEAAKQARAAVEGRGWAPSLSPDEMETGV